MKLKQRRLVKLFKYVQKYCRSVAYCENILYLAINILCKRLLFLKIV